MNPSSFQNMFERFLEAIERDMFQAKKETKKSCSNFLNIEGSLAKTEKSKNYIHNVEVPQ